MAQHINDTFVSQKKHASTQHWMAVHVHNEFPLGDFVLTVLEEYRRSKLLRFPKPPQVLNITKDQVLQSMHHYQPPIVLTNSVDENWGFFSTGRFNLLMVSDWKNFTFTSRSPFNSDRKSHGEVDQHDQPPHTSSRQPRDCEVHLRIR